MQWFSIGDLIGDRLRIELLWRCSHHAGVSKSNTSQVVLANEEAESKKLCVIANPDEKDSNPNDKKKS
jgi:hypothetical protein